MYAPQVTADHQYADKTKTENVKAKNTNNKVN